ncbi:MAG TPA: glycosyltransferase [Blastocatellia bacterium]|nr:glycosyltransferase [Blastocatellia bacterium]
MAERDAAANLAGRELKVETSHGSPKAERFQIVLFWPERGMYIIDLLQILLLLLVLQSAVALVEGVQHYRFVRRSIEQPVGNLDLSVSIIAPCKGLDTGLAGNLLALFSQDYPAFEIIFAIATEHDPARAIIEDTIRRHPERSSQLVIAGTYAGRGEKINNLLAGIARTNPDSEVLVFVDSDARPDPGWLRSLVQPLAVPTVGASTGYRWYLAPRNEPRAIFWSGLLSAWNGTVATTLGGHNRNFCWGGSTAIRRKTFESIGVAKYWEKAASDDYALTRAVQDAGLKITFVPRCLTVTREKTGLASLLEFTTRQIIITKVYRRTVWWVGAVSYTLFNLAFFGGTCLAGAVAAMHRLGMAHVSTVCLALVVIYLLGSAKGALRLAAAATALKPFSREVLSVWWAFCILWPLVSIVFMYNFLRSAYTRRIEWRGVRYELRSPDETIVLASTEQP